MGSDGNDREGSEKYGRRRHRTWAGAGLRDPRRQRCLRRPYYSLCSLSLPSLSIGPGRYRSPGMLRRLAFRLSFKAYELVSSQGAILSGLRARPDKSQDPFPHGCSTSQARDLGQVYRLARMCSAQPVLSASRCPAGAEHLALRNGRAVTFRLDTTNLPTDRTHALCAASSCGPAGLQVC